jgi:hypothetical protein
MLMDPEEGNRKISIMKREYSRRVCIYVYVSVCTPARLVTHDMHTYVIKLPIRAAISPADKVVHAHAALLPVIAHTTTLPHTR